MGFSSAFTLASSPNPRINALTASYLESLQTAAPLQQVNGVPAEASVVPSERIFSHAPMSYFEMDKLVSKGPRATFDWGTPQDWSRKFADDGAFGAGAWYCTEGGWPSPNGKGVTEIFYVLEGHGSLGDADGVTHYFGPGDMVIIPKGHTGRWDVNQPIHKVWAVNAHDKIEERSSPIRVQVDHYNNFAAHHLTETSDRDPLYKSTAPVSSSSNTFYDVGPTKVGVWACERGSFPVSSGSRAWFYMLEGVLFITDNASGDSKRCVAGDTVMLPEGWSGFVDVIEPAKKVWTTAA